MVVSVPGKLAVVAISDGDRDEDTEGDTAEDTAGDESKDTAGDTVEESVFAGRLCRTLTPVGGTACLSLPNP